MRASAASITVPTSGPATDLPSTLAGFKDRHRGETIVVCGCGASLKELPNPENLITIGVNDLGRLFDPTYLVVVNSRHQFSGDRFRYVENSRAQAVLSQLDLGIRHPHQVRFRLGKRGGTDFSDPNVLHYARNSPYVALCLAIHMGASRIGLIGVDFTDDHFFRATGTHHLTRELAVIDREYAALATAARSQGIEVTNVSPRSRLTGIPKQPLHNFLAAPDPKERPPANDSEITPMNASIGHLKGTTVGIERHAPGIIGDFLEAIARTATRLGCRVTRDARSTAMRIDAVTIVWNGRNYRGRGPTLYCEHGWLPRWSYQISPSGINATSHLAPFAWDGLPLGTADATALEEQLCLLRNGGRGSQGYMKINVDAAVDTPDAFILVPLQIEQDTNIQRHVPERFRRMQVLVDEVTRANPPLPVIYKQHPADARRGNRQLRLRVGRRQDEIWPHGRGNIHALLKGGRCKGIIALNSNVAHDGIIWDVPAVVLGRNIWPQGDDGPFLTRLPNDWDRLFELWSDRRRRACRDAYGWYLMGQQWSLQDAGDAGKVGALLASTLLRPAGVSAPARNSAIRPIRAQAGARINVVAVNRGWFFEDLKGHFAAASKPRALVLVSERPRRDADAWIFIRTREAAKAPNPERTVVQIHDMFDDGLYRPRGERHCVDACGAVVFTHPGQQEILTGSGIDLSGKLIMTRPIGAPQGFTLRTEQSDPFTVAWVGRRVVHRDQDLKRLDWVIRAVTGLGRDLRVILLGERLEHQYAALRRKGIDCRYLQRRTYPIERYPSVYANVDCVLIASRIAAGPKSLFEALATGVPVVSTPVGWATTLIQDGVNGFIVESPAEMGEAIERVREQRDDWFQRRAKIRASLGGYTLEGWIRDNLALVERLLKESRSGMVQRPVPAHSAARPRRRLKRAFCFGFLPWKHAWMRSYLRTFGESPEFYPETDLAAAKKALVAGEQAYVWGAPRRAALERALDDSTPGFKTVEDGFLRSIGLGLKKTTPLSLVFDRAGIYYDTSKPSDLERLLEELQLGNGQREVALKFVDLLVRSQLTKYNLDQGSRLMLPKRHGKRVVLVCGQVENDASLALAAPGIRSNLGLLEWTRDHFCDDTILYKAHPDVTIGRRPGSIDASFVRELADADVSDASLPACLERCDIVVVMTSLVGLEGLLRNKEVHCLGRPFYGGLGLTNDHFPWQRHRPERTLIELVYATYLAYPIYMSCEDERRLSPFEAVTELATQLQDEAVR